MRAIKSLASQQATATEDTEAKRIHLLNYCATHPDATIRYSASDMILNVHSDAGYLNGPEARSRAGGHFCMSSKPRNGEQQHNGSLLTLSTILRMVVASAAEAGIGALFLNAKECVNIRNIPKEMGQPQPATPMQTDNTTAHGILRGTCNQQRSKAIYICHEIERLVKLGVLKRCSDSEWAAPTFIIPKKNGTVRFIWF
jgi:hypothetical protein